MREERVVKGNGEWSTDSGHLPMVAFLLRHLPSKEPDPLPMLVLAFEKLLWRALLAASFLGGRAFRDPSKSFGGRGSLVQLIKSSFIPWCSQGSSCSAVLTCSFTMCSGRKGTARLLQRSSDLSSVCSPHHSVVTGNGSRENEILT